MRIILSDWDGSEVWAVLFDTLLTKVLAFISNIYTGLTSDAGRYDALITLCGPHVMVTIKKRTNDEATSSNIEKVQQWLDSNSDDIIFTPAAPSCSPASTVIVSDHAIENGSTGILLTGSISSRRSSSDNMEASGIDIIKSRTEAMLNHLCWYPNTCLFCFGIDIDWSETDRRGVR